MELNSSYDAVIVGAGPAGSMTAKSIAEKGAKVLLIEKELEIGVPDKCGEFIPSLEEMKLLAPDVSFLSEIFDPPKYCVINQTKFVSFIFPSNRQISVPFKGIVVERKLFDKHLANEAARAGAEILPHTKAVDLLKEGKVLRVKNVEGVFDIEAKVIVAADGAYSTIARKAGLPVSTDVLDYGIGYQYEMVNVDNDPEYVEMYFGSNIAPGTYAWIIPKGQDIANVGTGVRTPFMKKGTNIREYQANFIEKHPISSKKLTKAQATAIKIGVIPVGGPMEKTSTENTIAVGDAGGHTIPTVGGGIPPALICGSIAGEAVANHIISGEPVTNFDQMWKKQIGNTLNNSLRLRKMSDVIFQNENMIEMIMKKGWISEETIMKFVLCQIDAKMLLIEKTLQLRNQIFG